MKTRNILLRIALFDADVIIDLHRYRIWEHIIYKNKILVPSIVLRREVYFYEDEFGLKHSVDLLDKVGKNITELSTTADELRDFKSNFDRFIE